MSGGGDDCGSSCYVCGAKAGDGQQLQLQRCGRCKGVAYCGAAHQRLDWRRHRHECVRVREGDLSTGARVALSDAALERSFADEWHASDARYWAAAPATDDGMLGGLEADVAAPDVADSAALLDALLAGSLPPSGCPAVRLRGRRALDCGAGIGRVGRCVLSRRFARVDGVEPQAALAAVARATGAYADVAVCRLQQHAPPPRAYDLVWVQWVALYLSDAELADALRRCRAALVDDDDDDDDDCGTSSAAAAVVVVKDNVVRGDRFYVDVEDGSLIRCDAHMREVFARAGLAVIHAHQQPDLPQELFPVMSYVLR